MNTPKLRMFAGPNGSGKSTLFDHLRKRFAFSWGHCLNPDELDRRLAEPGQISFDAWGLNVSAAKLKRFIHEHALAGAATLPKISVRRNVLSVVGEMESGYLAAILSDYLRREWLSARVSFTFETVMSAPDKVQLLAEARRGGYRTYLYFICTENPAINEQRILNRKHSGGHSVPPEKIRPRYDRSLSYLSTAILSSSRAYLFDNSERTHRLVAEFEDGNLTQLVPNPPRWLVEFALRNPETL